MLEGKKVIIVGERDGVPGPAIEECIKTAGAEVVFLLQNALFEQPQAQWTLRFKVV